MPAIRHPSVVPEPLWKILAALRQSTWDQLKVERTWKVFNENVGKKQKSAAVSLEQTHLLQPTLTLLMPSAKYALHTMPGAAREEDPAVFKPLLVAKYPTEAADILAKDLRYVWNGVDPDGRYSLQLIHDTFWGRAAELRLDSTADIVTMIIGFALPRFAHLMPGLRFPPSTDTTVPIPSKQSSFPLHRATGIMTQLAPDMKSEPAVNSCIWIGLLHTIIDVVLRPFNPVPQPPGRDPPAPWLLTCGRIETGAFDSHHTLDRFLPSPCAVDLSYPNPLTSDEAGAVDGAGFALVIPWVREFICRPLRRMFWLGRLKMTGMSMDEEEMMLLITANSSRVLRDRASQPTELNVVKTLDPVVTFRSNCFPVFHDTRMPHIRSVLLGHGWITLYDKLDKLITRHGFDDERRQPIRHPYSWTLLSPPTPDSAALRSLVDFFFDFESDTSLAVLESMRILHRPKRKATLDSAYDLSSPFLCLPISKKERDMDMTPRALVVAPDAYLSALFHVLMLRAFDPCRSDQELATFFSGNEIHRGMPREPERFVRYPRPDVLDCLLDSSDPFVQRCALQQLLHWIRRLPNDERLGIDMQSDMKAVQSWLSCLRNASSAKDRGDRSCTNVGFALY